MSHVCTDWCQELRKGKCICAGTFLLKPIIPLSFLRKSNNTIKLNAPANSCHRAEVTKSQHGGPDMDN